MTFEDLIRAIMDRVLSRAKFYGFYLYEVVEDTTKAGASAMSPADAAPGRMTLRRVGDAAGLDDVLTVRKRHGAHGIYEHSPPGTSVLVGFEGGEKSRPFVGFYLPANPDTALVDAHQYVQIGATDPDRPDKRVYVGTSNRLPVARETDRVACGVLRFLGGVNLLTITYEAQDAPPSGVGTLAVVAGQLVWTPDPSTGGIVGIQGKIMAGSTFFRSE